MSYPGDLTTEGGRWVQRLVCDDFLPERDIVVSWVGYSEPE